MTRRLLITTLVVGTMIAMGAASQRTIDEDRSRDPIVRFEPIRVYLDTGGEPLAAYQLEIWSPQHRVRIVGIEGGEADRFAEPPYYDAAAMRGERVVIGALSTAPAHRLPTGRTRVATIHVQIDGDEDVEFKATLDAVATVGGRKIDAKVILERESQS